MSSITLVGTHTVSEHEAFEELERLFTDPHFRSTERNKKFLRYVSEELFQGREGTLKAYSIAVDVFGRPSSFDPIIDPIVRIEATRLRSSLEQYYGGAGQASKIHIELPKGRYVPTFSRRQNSPGLIKNILTHLTTDPEISAELSEKPPSPPRFSDKTRHRVLGCALFAAAAAGAAILTFMAMKEGPVISQKPSVSIEMKLAGDDTDADAVQLRDSLMVALSRFQTLRLASTEPFLASAAPVTASASSENVRSSAYHIVLKYRPETLKSSVWWQLVNRSTGEALKSGIETQYVEGRSSIEIEKMLAHALASQFADMRGIINEAETTREMVEPTLGNGCILRAYYALETMESTSLVQARDCLDATLALAPQDADSYALQAVILAEMDESDQTAKTHDRVIGLANRSATLAPGSARSAIAQMYAQYDAGHIPAAIEAGRRALSLNPNNTTALAKLGIILATTGHWDEGVPMVLKAEQMRGMPSSDTGIVLALDSYRKADYNDCLQRVSQMRTGDLYLANVLRIATLGQMGRRSDAEVAARQIDKYRSQIKTTFRSDMSRRNFSPAIVSLIDDGLLRAGVQL